MGFNETITNGKYSRMVVIKMMMVARDGDDGDDDDKDDNENFY